MSTTKLKNNNNCSKTDQQINKVNPKMRDDNGSRKNHESGYYEGSDHESVSMDTSSRSSKTRNPDRVHQHQRYKNGDSAELSASSDRSSKSSVKYGRQKKQPKRNEDDQSCFKKYAKNSIEPKQYKHQHVDVMKIKSESVINRSHYSPSSPIEFLDDDTEDDNITPKDLGVKAESNGSSAGFNGQCNQGGNSKHPRRMSINYEGAELPSVDLTQSMVVRPKAERNSSVQVVEPEGESDLVVTSRISKKTGNFIILLFSFGFWKIPPITHSYAVEGNI